MKESGRIKGRTNCKWEDGYEGPSPRSGCGVQGITFIYNLGKFYLCKEERYTVLCYFYRFLLSVYLTG